MTDTMTQEVVWSKVNAVRCAGCSNVMDAPGQLIDFEVQSEADVDDVYVLMDDLDGHCCDDPMLEAVIVAYEPVFGVPELDGQYVAGATPPTPFVPQGRTRDTWTYPLDEDLFDALKDAGVLDG